MDLDTGIPAHDVQKRPYIGVSAHDVQERTPLAHAGGLRRAVDVAVAGLGLLVLAPLLAVVAVAIRAAIGGPVLFRQARSGLDGVPFTIYKFRTMRDERYPGEPDADRTPPLMSPLRTFQSCGSSSMLDAEYIATPENLGPAGGIALGMRRCLDLADDDDPPARPSLLRGLAAFAADVSRQDPRVAAVGLVGARFDLRRGRLVRLDDRELTGLVPVDYIGGNAFPT